ncbi:MAG: sodium-dependent transporter [Gammaproteobacteria bacterium]|nr:MAG: sodium-dependent transporter [Gammaproteobacteria bacterium]
MEHTEARPHRGWASRWIFILAATGSAVGLGNIWKFPYITGEYGGGAFVLVYLACILVVGIPVMMAEVMLGRRGRRNPISSMEALAKEAGAPAAWSLIGWAGMLAGLMILSFYSVVAGWVLDYILRMADGSLTGASSENVTQAFTGLLTNRNELLGWHTAFILMTVAIVAGGVSKGLGNAARILMPLLFVLLLLLLGYSLASGDATRAFHFMFDFNASKLSGEAVLVALGHAFFTLSLGMGAMLAYGSYMPGKASIGGTVLMIAFLDTLIALIAGMAIFPLVFAHGLEPGSGPGLMFMSLPTAFGNMPGGGLFGTLFFILVGIAALTSAISLIEPGVAWLNETWHVKRLRASILLGLVGWLGGVACIFSNNWLETGPTDGWYVFETLDFVASNVMLPLGGLLIALFAGWAMKAPSVREELRDLHPALYGAWRVVIRFIAPIGIAVVFLNSTGLLKLG